MAFGNMLKFLIANTFRPESCEVWRSKALIRDQQTGEPFNHEFRPVLVVAVREEELFIIPGSSTSGETRYVKVLSPTQYRFLTKPTKFLCKHIQYQPIHDLDRPLGKISTADFHEMLDLADSFLSR